MREYQQWRAGVASQSSQGYTSIVHIAPPPRDPSHNLRGGETSTAILIQRLLQPRLPRMQAVADAVDEQRDESHEQQQVERST